MEIAIMIFGEIRGSKDQIYVRVMYQSDSDIKESDLSRIAVLLE